MRVLLLGGTGEARALAEALHSGGVDVVSSLAGRVSNPVLPVGAVRVGGFGGVDGLIDYLRRHAIDTIVDATHPFAQTITANAVAAARATELDLLILRRPGWTRRAGDHWSRVATLGVAAAAVQASPARSVFLTTGKRDLASFAADVSRHYLVRAVDPPSAALPPRHTLLLDRGPYTLDGELALMREHAVDVLVTKDSGGPLTVAKLDAARQLGVPVIMVDRPPLPAGVDAVESTDAALHWLRHHGVRTPAPGTGAG